MDRHTTLVNMAEEISLSIEETNKLRVSIGLAPIPENELEESGSNQKKNQDLATPNVPHEISIDETNKLRLSLGLKPIPTELGTTTSSREADEVNNFDTHQSEIKKHEREKLLKKRIEDSKSRNFARKRLANGSTLLENDDVLESTDDWLSRVGQPKENPKRQRTRARISDETNGMRVGHSSKDLLTLGDEDILTLNDTNVLEGEEAELTNDRLTRNRKLDRELNDKREADHVKNNGRRIRGFSMEDDDENNMEEENSMMITNAVIELPKDDHTLREDSKEAESSKGAIKISDLFAESELPDIEQSSDYSKTKKPQKMKKLKKKTSLKARNKKDLVDAGDDEEINIKPVELENLETDLLTDELELDSMLATSRRQRQKARKFMTPEDLAKELKLIDRWDEESKLDDLVVSTQKKGGIVYDDTSDFLNSLNTNILVNQGDRNIDSVKTETEVDTESVKPEPKIKEEDDDPLYSKHDSHDRSQQQISGDTIVKNEDQKENSGEPIETPTFNGGLASTLKFLQLRNIIQLQGPDQNEKSRLQQNALKDAELLKLKISIESRLLREQLEADRSFMNLPKDERESIFESQLDEVLKEKNIFSSSKSSKNDRGTANKLSNYSPSVQLSYRDESGNTLSTKEAFKYLSHKFHGVGPGKGKIDKKLKKLQHARDQNSNNEEII